MNRLQHMGRFPTNCEHVNFYRNKVNRERYFLAVFLPVLFLGFPVIIFGELGPVLVWGAFLVGVPLVFGIWQRRATLRHASE